MEEIAMRWIALGLICLGMIRVAGAQTTATPSGNAHVVRVRMGGGGGMGCAMYCTTVITVDASSVVSEFLDAPDKKEYPDKKQTRATTKQEWRELVRSIDAKKLRAVPQDGQCRPCIDLPDAFVEVDYSDGSKISVEYSPGAEPTAVRAIKMPFLQATF
jgi:hypothetical protein